MIQVCYQKRKNIWYGAAVWKDQVLATDFSRQKPELKQIIRKFPQETPFQVVKKPDQVLSNVLSALEGAFNGNNIENYEFKINLILLSSYSQKVLNCTLLVPVGYVTTYIALAKVAGGIARSVGRVEASNPVPLLIPCHRVVCSDLSIGGYGYGEQTKMAILENEERGYEESKRLIVKDKELPIYPIKLIKQKNGYLLRDKRTAYNQEDLGSSSGEK